MAADMMELETRGFDLLRVERTGEARERLRVSVRGEGALSDTLEELWKSSLRLSKESYHTLTVGPPTVLRFATKGSVGYITGRITAEGKP